MKLTFQQTKGWEKEINILWCLHTLHSGGMGVILTAPLLSFLTTGAAGLPR